MSKMANLYMEIEEMLQKGTHPATISAVLDVPVIFIYDVVESIEGQTEELSPFRTINS
jgi:hypothetical protein